MMYNLLALFLFSGILNATTNFAGVDPSAKVVNVMMTDLEPDKNSDGWVSMVAVSFDNGLIGCIEKKFLYASQAKDELESLKRTLDNQIGHFDIFIDFKNYIHYYQFKSENKTLLREVYLFLNDKESFDQLPVITGIEELVTSYWFLNKYSYLIQLSNGIVITTNDNWEQWTTPWPVNSRILFIGRNDNPYVYNIDGLSKEPIEFKESLNSICGIDKIQ